VTPQRRAGNIARWRHDGSVAQHYENNMARAKAQRAPYGVA